MASLKMTKAWFQLAIRDLKSAKALLDLGPEHKHAAAYFSQQCAEKSIKGFLTFIDSRVPKTHDLEVLGQLAAAYNKTLAKFILKHKSLSELAVNYRYPSAEKKPLTQARTKAAARQAHLIYDRCFEATFGKSDGSRFITSFRI